MGGLREAPQDRKSGADAAWGDGSEGARGIDVERAQAGPRTGVECSARAEASNHLGPERSRVARSEYCDRGITGLAGDSQVEGSECARHRGVSAEQGGRVMRVLKGRAADAYVRSLERRSGELSKVESVVRRIVDDVRKRGDQAL